MNTKQPVWKFVANLGDANPIDHGGLFVYVDETGVYAPEMERLEPSDDGKETWEVRRVCLDKCTFVDGVLSDNKFHPSIAAWFAKDIEYLASFLGIAEADFIEMICSNDAMKLAVTYEAIGQYHGWDNLDAYPLTFTKREEIEARYDAEFNRVCKS